MKKFSLILIAALFVLWPNFLLRADNLAGRLAGRILLAVESRGEAWYLSPDNAMRYFLGRPADAFAAMRGQGVGITNANLERIPIGLSASAPESASADTDGDGLADGLEDALGTDKHNVDTDNDTHGDKNEIINGYNPSGSGILPIDLEFARKQSGRIFLAVESRGEAWYVNPVNNRRYFLGRPADAFALMRNLGLGISDQDLNNIIAYTPNYNLSEMELEIYDLINKERANEGLEFLKWNPALAETAHRHSQDLAEENKAFTGMSMSCNYPLIHHEGFSFGLYSQDRLHTDNIYYFNKSGENIALMPGAAFTFIFNSRAEADTLINNCKAKQAAFDSRFDAAIESETDGDKKLSLIREEIAKRTKEFKKEKILKLSKIDWDSSSELARETVSGWMESPGHKENILTPDFTETGIGIAYVNSYIIATQVFIKRASCGFKTGACCEEEGYYPYCYKPLECVDNICGD